MMSKYQLAYSYIIEASTTWAPLMMISYFFKNYSFIEDILKCVLIVNTSNILKNPFQKETIL